VLSDADFVSVVQKEVKKRRDSIEQFEKGGRAELAEKEKKEIPVLESFLPKALSPEELEQLVKASIQELGATGKKEMGAVIKAVQAKAAGRADGKNDQWIGRQTTAVKISGFRKQQARRWPLQPLGLRLP